MCVGGKGAERFTLKIIRTTFRFRFIPNKKIRRRKPFNGNDVLRKNEKRRRYVYGNVAANPERETTLIETSGNNFPGT